MPIVGQFGSLAGMGSFILPGGAMESIATVTVGSGGASSIEFVDIPGGFSHLQVRVIARCTATGDSASAIRIRFNGTTAGNTSYARHYILGDGSTTSAGSGTSSDYLWGGSIPNSGTTASCFGAGVIDVLDYASTSKNKTTRSLSGISTNSAVSASNWVELESGLYASTNAITSVLMYPPSGNFAQYSTASLYGLRAP